MARAYLRHRFDRSICVEITRLYALDNWHAPLALLVDFGIILAAIEMTHLLGWVFYPLAVLVIGSRQRALSTIVHEAAHCTLARSKHLTMVLGTVCSGFLLFSTLSAYKASHVTGHHGRFGEATLDPDYRYMLAKGVYSIRKPGQLLWTLILQPLLLINVPSYLTYVVRARTFCAGSHSGRGENLAVCVYWAVIIGVAGYFGAGWELLLFWGVPLLTAFHVIGWFIELAEHGPLMRNRLNLYMTRNRNSRLVELLLTGMHGESYHLAHHLWPRVPFWHMARLHRILLRDPDYWRWNNQSGGIFLSDNGAPCVVALLLQQSRGPRLLRCAML